MDENESDFSRSSINSHQNPLERNNATSLRLRLSKKGGFIKGTKISIEKYFPEKSY